MSNSDVLLMALKNLFKRKVRTLLTVLGVVIGTAAIVVMISLGIGVNMSFEEQMKMMGDVTVIEIYNWDGYYGYDKSAPVLDNKAIAAIEKFEGVQVATPIMDMWGLKMVSGRYSANVQIMGIRPEAMQYLGYTAEEGRLLESTDELQVVFGSDVAFQFATSRDRNRSYYYWDSRSNANEGKKAKVDVLMDRIQMSYDQSFGEPNQGTGDDPNTPSKKPVKPYTIKGVGILQRSDNYMSSMYCFMNIETLQKIAKEKEKYEQSLWGGRGNSTQTKGYQQAKVKCDDIKNVEKVIENIQGMGFTQVYSPTMYIKSLQEMTGSLQALLGAIGGVSLFVAAIGITNTMIMSIYERTREIGVMKVIGAALKDIRKLFLVEAALIGALGGVFGIGLSYLVSYIINNVGISFFSMLVYGDQSRISYIPLWLCLGALAFSALIGLVSGYLPARRAMKLSALSAIRME